MTKRDSQSLHIKASAAAWLARLRSEKRTPEDEAAFRNWLAADSAHAAAFEMMNVVWDAAGPHRDLRRRIPSAEGHINRRVVFGGVAVAAGIGGTLVLTETAQAKVYQTEIGEQRHVLLNDGTELFLDTDTKIVANVSKKSRKATLEYGRANFRVAPDGSSPFTVNVAGDRITGNQSTFDIRRDGEKVSVVLLQGQAAVEATDSGKPPVKIFGGERLISIQKSVKLDKPDLLPLLAWQTGQAIFRDETLVEAANEMNRYSTLRLEVADPRIRNLKVAGVYRVGDNAEFALALQKLLPVRARQFDDRIEIVADERSPQI
jgi:transmembrane sensor